MWPVSQQFFACTTTIKSSFTFLQDMIKHITSQHVSVRPTADTGVTKMEMVSLPKSILVSYTLLQVTAMVVTGITFSCCLCHHTTVHVNQRGFSTLTKQSSETNCRMVCLHHKSAFAENVVTLQNVVCDLCDLDI